MTKTKSLLTPEEYEAFFLWLTDKKGLSELTAQLYAGHISRSAELSSYSYRSAMVYYAEYINGNKKPKNEFRIDESGDSVLVLHNRKGEVTLIPVRSDDWIHLVSQRWFISTNAKGHKTVCTKVKGKITTMKQFLEKLKAV